MFLDNKLALSLAHNTEPKRRLTKHLKALFLLPNSQLKDNASLYSPKLIQHQRPILESLVRNLSRRDCGELYILSETKLRDVRNLDVFHRYCVRKSHGV